MKKTIKYASVGADTTISVSSYNCPEHLYDVILRHICIELSCRRVFRNNGFCDDNSVVTPLFCSKEYKVYKYNFLITIKTYPNWVLPDEQQLRNQQKRIKYQIDRIFS